MVNIEKLDEDLTTLVEKKIALSQMNYADKDYDKIEEELHDLEDVFMENYGEYLEEALQDVHDEFCPDNDVLMPIAYLADKYVRENGSFDIPKGQGVLVDADDFPGMKTTISLVPKPTRLVIQSGNDFKQDVWVAKA